MTRARTTPTPAGNHPLRAVLYHRVSTDEQAASGAGLDAQREATTAVCAYKGWTAAATFDDGGFSGKTTERPGLMAALDLLAAGEADVLVVSKLDRLSRSVQDFLSLMSRAQKQGWDLCIRDLDLDTSHPNGRMVLSIMSVLSQWEREMIGLRTKEALAVRKAQGVKLGRRPMDPQLLARIQAMRREPMTLAGIAAVLNADGVPTPQGGEKWRDSSIRAALNSQASRALA